MLVIKMNSEIENRIIEYSDEHLIKVLKERNKYTNEAKEVIIKESLQRGIITSIDELDIKYPLMSSNKSDKPNKSTKKTIIDFKENVIVLYLIGLTTWAIIYFSLDSVFPVVPIIYIVLITYCYLKYDRLLANIILWIAAFQIVAITIFILSTIFRTI
jgi:hypothetical protein